MGPSAGIDGGGWLLPAARRGEARPEPMPFVGTLREARDVAELVVDKPPMVVMRWAWVVSSDGGGGREDRSGSAGSRKARQRKHSPVP